MSGKNKLLTFCLIMVSATPFLHAQTQPVAQDTDLDGLSDQAETEIYNTNINNSDTDLDGVLDYQEIIDQTNPNNPESNKINSMKPTSTLLETGNPVLWYVGRVAGIGAFIMFTFVVWFGLIMTSKFLLKFPILSAPNALEAHSFNASFIAFTLLVIHFVSFMFDDIIKLNLLEVLIPFYAHREIKTSMGYNIDIPMALGIIAFYLSAVLITTSRLRAKVVPVKIWRSIHYASFAFYLIFWFHGLFTGSDSNEVWMRLIYSISMSVTVLLVLTRIFMKKYFISSLRR